MEESSLSVIQTRIALLFLQIWSKFPMLRFNQLVDNLQTLYNNENGKAMTKKAYTGKTMMDMEIEYVDAFYLEDNVFLAWLERYYSTVMSKEEENND